MPATPVIFEPVSFEAFRATVFREEESERLDQVWSYVLIDQSGARGALNEIRKYSRLSCQNLFEESGEASAMEVAPLLIQLDSQDSASSNRLLQWLHHLCQYTTSLVVVRSPLAMHTMVAALKRRMQALLPQASPMLLRYFDSRTLAALPLVLESKQLRAFLGIGCEWLWLDRAGQLVSRTSELAAQDNWPDTFEFSETQQNKLLEASEADALVYLMLQQSSDACEGWSRAALHALAENCLPILRKLGITSPATQALFCVAEIELGPDFSTMPPWLTALEPVAKGTRSFEDVLRELAP